MSLIRRVLSKYRADGAISTFKSFSQTVATAAHSCLARAYVRNETTVNGVILDLEEAPVRDTMQTALYTNDYEKQEVRAIKHHLATEIDVIELGACLGFVSCVIDQVLSNDSVQVAVEPNPTVIESIVRTRDQNDATFNILPNAYDPTADQVRITPTRSAWSASVHRSGGEAVEVETIDLKTIINRYKIADAALIVDIEGHEAELIEEELEIIERCCSLLIIEFHHENTNFDPQRQERIADAKRRLDKSNFTSIDNYGGVEVYLQE